MRYFAFPVLWAILLTGCQVSEKAGRLPSNSAEQKGPKKNYSQLTLKEETNSPNIGISSYTLITNNAEAHRGDAEAIMRLKKDLPLAMQTKDASLFDRILARDFTFRAEDEFYERAGYIRNRVERPQTVSSAQYENLVLQLFGDVAVLTYRNIVKVNDAIGRVGTYHMSWADIYVKENGEWKIGAIHLIEARVDKSESAR